MTVKAQELPPKIPPEKAPSEKSAGRTLSIGERLAFVALALLAVAFAVPGWLRGARYTVEGWAYAIGWVAREVATIQLTVQLGTGERFLALIIAVGLAYSLAEFVARPRRGWMAWGPLIFLAAIVVWLLVIGTDIGTTVLGVVVAPDDTAFEQWVAARRWAAGIYGVVLTFYPEGLIVLAAVLIRAARRGRL